MAEASIPADLRNPGQVFACLGLMEAAEILLGEEGRPATVFGRYGWEEGETAARFTLTTDSERDPLREVLSFLSRARVVALNAPRPELGPLPAGSLLAVRAETTGWKVETQPHPGAGGVAFPVSPPSSPAPLPIKLEADGRSIPVSSWADEAVLGRDNVKFWAGSGGYPGAALARDALLLVEGLSREALEAALANPFAVGAPQSSSFSFDWRRSYVPLDAGFSPNAHASFSMVGYPLVELLAAIGLEHARPQRPDRANKLSYRYAVSDAALPTLLARAVLGGADLGHLHGEGPPGLRLRRFHIQLGWPGQEGQARCIIDSRED